MIKAIKKKRKRNSHTKDEEKVAAEITTVFNKIFKKIVEATLAMPRRDAVPSCCSTTSDLDPFPRSDPLGVSQQRVKCENILRKEVAGMKNDWQRARDD